MRSAVCCDRRGARAASLRLRISARITKNSATMSRSSSSLPMRAVLVWQPGRVPVIRDALYEASSNGPKADASQNEQTSTELTRCAAQVLDKESGEVRWGTETEFRRQLGQHHAGGTQCLERVGDPLLVDHMLRRDPDRALELAEEMRPRHARACRQRFNLDALYGRTAQTFKCLLYPRVDRRAPASMVTNAVTDMDQFDELLDLRLDGFQPRHRLIEHQRRKYVELLAHIRLDRRKL